MLVFTNLFFQIEALFKVPYEAQYWMNHAANQLFNIMTIVEIYLIYKSYQGKTHLIYDALIIATLRNLLPFFGLSIFGSKLQENSRNGFIDMALITGSFFNSFVILLCFQRTSRFYSIFF